jgi:ABC-2 type transport system permease protein
MARQPRLLLVLVAGPFVILLLFGIGYDQQQAVLHTAFVGPRGSIYEESIDEFADDLEKYVSNAGYTDDLVDAERRLSAGELDAIVVFPPEPLDTVMAGSQAEIAVLHDKIDPIQRVAVEVSAQVAVMELNARILEAVVGRAQDTLAPVPDSLALARDQVDGIASAIERDDIETVDRLLVELQTSTESLDTAIRTSGELADALGGDDTTRTSLNELGQAVTRLIAAVDALPEDGASPTTSDLAEVRSQLDEVSQMTESAVTIEPSVAVRPFSTTTASLQREPIEVNDYFAPAAVALLLQHMVLTFAAMSLVSDRTLGMFEIYRVGPVDAGRVMAGKYLAFMIVGGAVGAALLGLMVAALGLPMRGPIGWVAVGLIGLPAASIGFGMTLSLLARSDVQAVQFAMLALLAGLFFGGFFLDLDAFTYPVKLLSWALPVTYGTSLFRDVMLRGNTPSPTDQAGLLATTIAFGVFAWTLLHRQLRTR